MIRTRDKTKGKDQEVYWSKIVNNVSENNAIQEECGDIKVIWQFRKTVQSRKTEISVYTSDKCSISRTLSVSSNNMEKCFPVTPIHVHQYQRDTTSTSFV